MLAGMLVIGSCYWGAWGIPEQLAELRQLPGMAQTRANASIGRMHPKYSVTAAEWGLQGTSSCFNHTASTMRPVSSGQAAYR